MPPHPSIRDPVLFVTWQYTGRKELLSNVILLSDMAHLNANLAFLILIKMVLLVINLYKVYL